MKNKLFLAITSIALATALVIGGTLMLFTAQTNIAQNVVTMGNNISAVLREHDKNGDTDLVEINYTDVEPTQTLIKQPFVKNTGDKNIYVKMEGTLSFTISTLLKNTYGTKLRNWLDPNGTDEGKGFVINDTNAKYWTLNKEVFAQNNDMIECTDNGNGTFTYTVKYTWYYTETSNDISKLASLSYENGVNKTPYVFTKLYVMDMGSDLAEGFVFNLDLVAYVVQADNVQAAEGLPAFVTFFDGQFPVAAPVNPIDPPDGSGEPGNGIGG